VDDRELKKVFDKLYKMYIYDEEVCTIKDNDTVSKITDKLIELDEKIIKAYNEHLLKEDDFKEILEEYFYTYNEMTCAYRKNDFQQGLMIGLALNKFSQSFINTEVLNKWMERIYNEKYHEEG
jgi:hypothetical protein